jgi:hypothetical protein
MEVSGRNWRTLPSIAVHVVPAYPAFESRLSRSRVSACAHPVVPVSYPRPVVSSRNIQPRLLMRLIATILRSCRRRPRASCQPPDRMSSPVARFPSRGSVRMAVACADAPAGAASARNATRAAARLTPAVGSPHTLLTRRGPRVAANAGVGPVRPVVDRRRSGHVLQAKRFGGTAVDCESMLFAGLEASSHLEPFRTSACPIPSNRARLS